MFAAYLKLWLFCFKDLGWLIFTNTAENNLAQLKHIDHPKHLVVLIIQSSYWSILKFIQSSECNYIDTWYMWKGLIRSIMLEIEIIISGGLATSLKYLDVVFSVLPNFTCKSLEILTIGKWETSNFAKGKMKPIIINSINEMWIRKKYRNISGNKFCCV